MIELSDAEQILLFRRRHWLTLILSLIPISIGIIVVFAAPFFISAAADSLNISLSLVWFGAMLILQIFWTVSFVIITDYYLDTWIVTNNRLVFIELHSLFRRSVSSIDLGAIQDLTVEVYGILPTFFKYGTIVVHTSGDEQGFRFKDIPQPYAFKDELLRIQARVREGVAPTGITGNPEL